MGSFVVPAGNRIAAAGGGGLGGRIAAIMMACPLCSPLAIPLLGAGGALSFPRGGRAWLALASVLVLGLTLVLRLRATVSCPIPKRPRSQASLRPVR